MSAQITQARDIIFYAVNSVKQSSRTEDESCGIKVSASNTVINQQVTERIIQVLQHKASCGDNLKLHDIIKCLDDKIEAKSKIVTECVDGIFELYKTRSLEEVTKEVVDVLSKIQVCARTARASNMTTKEIRETFENGLCELFKQTSDKSAFPFEIMLRSKDPAFLKRNVAIDLSRRDSLCFLAAKSTLDAILVESNLILSEMINSFIQDNGLITAGVAIDILLNYLSKNILETSPKIEKQFIHAALADEQILKCCCLMQEEQPMKIKHLGKYIQIMLGRILQNDDKRVTKNTYIDLSIRAALFNSSFLINEEFEICLCLITFIKEFLNVNNDIKISLKNMLSSLFKEQNTEIQDYLLESITSIYLTTIIYSNAALNGVLDRDAVKNMTRNEIIKQICSYVSNEKIDYSRDYNKLYNFILCALLLRDDVILKEKDPHSFMLKIVNEAQIFLLLTNPTKESYRDLLLSIINKFNNYIITIPDRIEGAVVVKQTDAQLRLMLMMAINREAENFIKHNQATVVVEFLHYVSPGESLTKTEQAIKRFLVATFLSVLATVFNNRFAINGNNDEESQNLELRLKYYLEQNYQLHDCLEFSEKNILSQIQTLLINLLVYSNIRAYIHKNKETFVGALSTQLAKALQSKDLDKTSKFCLERTLYICRYKQDVKILLDKFLFYIFSEFVEKAHLNSKEFEEKGNIIELQTHLILNSEIPSLLESSWIVDLKTIFKGRLFKDKSEFTKIKQNSNSKKSTSILEFLDFDSQKTNKVKIPNEPEQYIPILITAVIIRMWSVNQGLTKLKEIKASQNIPTVAEIICSITDREEILRLVKVLSTSPIDRELFELCLELSSCNEQHKASITEIECSLLFTLLTLKELNQLNEYILNIFDDLINSAKKINKIQKHKQSKLNRQQQAAQDRQREKLKQQDLKAKQEQLRLEESSSSLSSMTFEEPIQKELSSNSYSSSSVTEEKLNSSEPTQSNNSQTQNVAQTTEDFITTESSIQNINTPSTTDLERARKEGLLSKSVSEVEYEAQAAALDSIHSKFGDLTDREKEMLAMFFSNMQEHACKPLYEKGKLEASLESETKESFEQHAVSDLAELEGAAANLQTYYEVIIPRSFTKWLNKLNPKTREDINKRLDQIVSLGVFGNSRSIHHKLAGAFELKFVNAYGTRVYYIVNNKTVYILCGGDKDDQDEIITSRLKSLVGEVKLRYKF